MAETFNYTGSVQSWTAPTSGVVQITLDGPAGGDGGSPFDYDPAGNGAAGGRIELELYVNSGETYDVYVGGQGANGDQQGGSGGWGYRDGGGGGSPTYGGGGGGGGGATGVLDPNGNVVATAGGGGGGGGGVNGFNDGGGGGGGARGGAAGGGAGGSSGGGSGAGGDGGNGADGASDNDGHGGGSVLQQGTQLSASTGGGSFGDGQVAFGDVQTEPNAPSSVDASYVADDQLDVQINGDTSGSDIDHYDVQIERDGGSWEAPAGGPSQPSSDGTHSYGPSQDAAYNRQVGVDSSFQFRVRAANSVGTSSWTYSDTVYTTPVPPHAPEVSRPDGETVRIHGSVQSDLSDKLEIQYREDTGSGYGSWTTFDYVVDSDHPQLISGSVQSKGSGFTIEYVADTTASGASSSFTTDSRAQFRLRTLQGGGTGNRKSDWVYADYGNDGGVYFTDDFESGDFSAWNTNISDADSGVYSGSNAPGSGDAGISGADDGTYYAWLESGDFASTGSMDLSGESGVIVKCAMAAGSMDSSAESIGLVWYDGSAWQDLRRFSHEYNKQGWVEVAAAVPDSWLASNSNLRITGYGGGGDHAAFDRVVVADVLHEYTTPDAPGGLSASEGYRELSASWTRNADTFPTSSVEVRTRVTGSGDPYDKNGVDPSTTSHTWEPGSGFDEPVPTRDGEQYDVRVDNLSQQYRRGSISNYWRAVSGVDTAITDLPAPGALDVVDVTATSGRYTWQPSHNYGQTRVEYRETDASTWQTYTTVGNDVTEATVDGLLHGEAYDARVVAETEHAEAVDN